MDESLANCRLCNYKSDQRLMLNVFEEPISYSEKIESYLDLKIPLNDTASSTCICFHCSQTLDNFHNFATKIKAIQKILFAQQEVREQIEVDHQGITYEICVVPEDDETPHIEVEEAAEIIKNDTALKEEEDDNWEESTQTEMPAKLLDSNGFLLYKGKELMRMMSKFFNLDCELCGLTFKRINDLFRHQKNEHSSITPYISCCSGRLTKMPGIIWHFVRHIEPEPFRCPICSYSVSRPKFLERHIQTHADPSEKNFSCDKCDKRFIWKGALRAHLLNHQPEADRKDFTCIECNRKYLSAGALSWHKKRSHSSVVRVQVKNLCEICSKTFATLTSFKEHMLVHSEDCEKLQLQCPKCGKWLKNQRCLKSHLTLHNEITYNCEHCSYTTKKEALLKNHVITRHTLDRPWKCSECDKTFKVKRALTVHTAQSHTDGAKSGRTCEFCGKHFGSSTNYYTHRKNLHAAELANILAKKDEDKKMTRIKIGLENPS